MERLSDFFFEEDEAIVTSRGRSFAYFAMCYVQDFTQINTVHIIYFFVFLVDAFEAEADFLSAVLPAAAAATVAFTCFVLLLDATGTSVTGAVFLTGG